MKHLSLQIKQAISCLPDQLNDQELLAIVAGIVSVYTNKKEDVPQFLKFAAIITAEIVHEEGQRKAASAAATHH